MRCEAGQGLWNGYVGGVLVAFCIRPLSEREVKLV